MNLRGHRLVALVSLAIVIFLWAPLVIVAINSVNQNELLASWQGFTLRWFGEALVNPEIRSGVRSSLTISALSSVLSVAIAVTGALWWRRASARARKIFDLTTYLRLILPEVVFAVGLFTLFARLRFPLGTAAVVIGHTVWNSAFATLIIQARLAALDPALEDAAADLGAGPWRIFRRVTIPGLLPGMIAAGLLAFTFSFDDVVTSFFLSGPNVTPLPVTLVSMIRFRVGPSVNAIAMLVMVFTIITFAFGVTVVSRVTRGSRSQISIGGKG